MRRVFAISSLIFATACSDCSVTEELEDAGIAIDAGEDAGLDAGIPDSGRDAGAPPDTGAPDTGEPDAGALDAEAPDFGPSRYAAAVLADLPVAYWRFGDDRIAEFADETGTHDLRSFGLGITPELPGALVNDANTAIGISESRLEPVMSSDLATWVHERAQYSIELWIRYGEQLGTCTHIDVVRWVDRANFWNGHLRIDRARDGVISFWGSQDEVRSQTSLADSTWHHVIAQFDGTINATRIYVDGALAHEEIIVDRDPVTIVAPDALLAIGGYPGGTARCEMSGELDEMAIYPQILTASTARAHWCLGRTGTSTTCP